jgi:drug/metabolite transporter (DMT)-like permease
MTDRAAVAAMVAATALWGATFVVIRDSVATIPPVTLVCARFAVASVPLLAIAGLRRRAGAPWPWRGGAIAGLCYAGGFAFQAIGLTSTSAGSSGFLTFVGTALAAVWAWALFGQRPAPAVGAGLLAALAGSALLSSGGVPGRGEAWTLLGAALFGAQIVVLARFAPGADAFALTAVQSVTMALALAPFAGGWDAFRSLDGATWARFAYLAIAGSLVATTLQTWAQARLSAGRTALLFGLEPVFALAFALAVGGERFVPRWWLGAALILGGVLFSEWRSSRAIRPATS